MMTTYFFAQPVARRPDDARLAARRADFSRHQRPTETRRRRPLRFLASPSFSPARFLPLFLTRLDVKRRASLRAAARAERERRRSVPTTRAAF